MFRPSPPYRFIYTVRLRIVLSSDTVTRFVCGNTFYDYYGFICRPPARNGHISAPLRKTLSMLQRSGTGGPSPGKIISLLCPSVSSTGPGYGKDTGLRQLRVPRPPGTACRRFAPSSDDRSDYGFLQIPHWLPHTVGSLVGQCQGVSSDTLAFICMLPPLKAHDRTFTG